MMPMSPIERHLHVRLWKSRMPMSAGVAAILAVIGVACAAYGLRFVFSETKMRFHLVWFALAAALVAPAVLVAAGVWDIMPVVLHWIPAAVLAAFAAYELLVGAAVGRHFNDTAAPGLDYVVVLGAQVLGGKPGRTFAVRLDAALAYLSENPRCRCVVCGGQGPNESIPEAHAGCNYLVERGIDRERILLEASSHNTAQNLRAAAELVDPENDAIGIVTHNYHMARSLAIARKAGMKHVSGIAVECDERFPLNDIVRETFAWAKDFLCGNA